MAASVEEAVTKHGELGLVRVLAAHDGIQCRIASSSLNADLSGFRDTQILNVLEAEVERGERVFAVIGASHVLMQEAFFKHD